MAIGCNLLFLMNYIIICDEIDIMQGSEIKKIISERRTKGETFRCISSDMNIRVSFIHSILNKKLSQKKIKVGPKKLHKAELLSIIRKINEGVTQSYKSKYSERVSTFGQ